MVQPGSGDGYSPLVIAHRGASEEYAEHTLAAYETALAEGADGFECDVRLTADGVMVCLHDRRIERTSDGNGVVSTLTYDELSQRDYGSWKPLPVESPERRPSLHGLLRLEQLLEFAIDAPRSVSLSIETKHPVRFGGMVERRLAQALKHYGVDDPNNGKLEVRMMSFSSVAIRRMKNLVPDIPLVYLMDRVPVLFRDGTLPRDVGIAGPGIHILREYPNYVEKVHRAGNKVHVWTVDSAEDVQLCMEQKVDAMITNRPRRVLERLGR